MATCREQIGITSVAMVTSVHKSEPTLSQHWQSPRQEWPLGKGHVRSRTGSHAFPRLLGHKLSHLLAASFLEKLGLTGGVNPTRVPWSFSDKPDTASHTTTISDKGRLPTQAIKNVQPVGPLPLLHKRLKRTPSTLEVSVHCQLKLAETGNMPFNVQLMSLKSKQ